MAVKKFLDINGFKHFVEKVIGKTDISTIGDGTVKGAIWDINQSLGNKDSLVALSTYTEANSSTQIALLQSYKKFKKILIILGTTGNSAAGLELREIPTECIVNISNQFCGIHHHNGLNQYYSEYQYGFTSDKIIQFLYVNNNSQYKLALTVYGVL